jgi:hypothetical protein
MNEITSRYCTGASMSGEKNHEFTPSFILPSLRRDLRPVLEIPSQYGVRVLLIAAGGEIGEARTNRTYLSKSASCSV